MVGREGEREARLIITPILVLSAIKASSCRRESKGRWDTPSEAAMGQ